MAAAAFLGYLLLAGGAPLVIWCSFVANKSFLVLLALARWAMFPRTSCASKVQNILTHCWCSAFYWLISLLAVALLFRGMVLLPSWSPLLCSPNEHLHGSTCVQPFCHCLNTQPYMGLLCWLL